MLGNYPIPQTLAIGLFAPLHTRKFLDECYEKSIVQIGNRIVVLLFDQIMRDSEFLKLSSKGSEMVIKDWIIRDGSYPTRFLA
jgi:hypothetical protein